MGVSRHFGHACSGGSSGHTGCLRGVASALVAGASRRITSHGASGCVGGARDGRLPCSIFIVWSAIAAVERGASHSWIMHPAIGAVVLVVFVSCGKAARSAQGAELCVAVLLVLARPELALARAGSVVIGWRRPVALLSLMGAGEADLEGGGDEEEESSGKVLAGPSNGPCGKN